MPITFDFLIVILFLGSCQGEVHVVGKEIIQNHCHTTDEPVVSIIYNGSSSKASEVHQQDENGRYNICILD